LPLSGVVEHSSALRAAALPAHADLRGIIACSLLSASEGCTGRTFGDARAAGAIFPNARLAALDGNLQITIGQIAPGLSPDIEVGMLEAEDYPWEDLDVTTSGIQEFGVDATTLPYTARLRVVGGAGSVD